VNSSNGTNHGEDSFFYATDTFVVFSIAQKEIQSSSLRIALLIFGLSFSVEVQGHHLQMSVMSLLTTETSLDRL
jgi:hypothetical protein